jgi:hypothetical protein
MIGSVAIPVRAAYRERRRASALHDQSRRVFADPFPVLKRYAGSTSLPTARVY